MVGSQPFAGHIGENGKLVMAGSLVLLMVSLLVIIIRGYARCRSSRIIETTDIILPTSWFLALGQTVAVCISINYGLGTHSESLDQDDMDGYQKFFYAASILFVLTLSLSRAAITLLLKNVEPQAPVLVGCNILLALIAIHTIGVTLSLGFQCTSPSPWVYFPGQCINSVTLYYAMIATNTAIDLAIILLAITMMWMLRAPRKKKVYVSCLFGTRIVVPLATIPQLYYFHVALQSNDQTWDFAVFQIWSQVIINLSIITACIPSLGRVMWEFGSGFTTYRSSKDVEWSTRKLSRSTKSSSIRKSNDKKAPSPRAQALDITASELSVRALHISTHSRCSIEKPKRTYWNSTRDLHHDQGEARKTRWLSTINAFNQSISDTSSVTLVLDHSSESPSERLSMTLVEEEENRAKLEAAQNRLLETIINDLSKPLPQPPHVTEDTSRWI